MMATISTPIRIDEVTKKQAVEVLDNLGLSLSDAINLFLKQVVLQNRMPFDVKYPISKLNKTEESNKEQDPSYYIL